MLSSPMRRGFSVLPRVQRNIYAEKMSAPNNAEYVLKVLHAGLPNAVLHSSFGIGDLPDVTITAPADNELLAFDSGTNEWINQTSTEAGLDALFVKKAGDTMVGDLFMTSASITQTGDVNTGLFMQNNAEDKFLFMSAAFGADLHTIGMNSGSTFRIQRGSTDFQLSDAGLVVISPWKLKTANAKLGTMDVAPLTDDRTWTFPDITGNIVIDTNSTSMSSDFTTTSTSTAAPTADIESLTVRQTSFATPTANIASFTNSAGTIDFFVIDKDGKVRVGPTAPTSVTKQFSIVDSISTQMQMETTSDAQDVKYLAMKTGGGIRTWAWGLDSSESDRFSIATDVNTGPSLTSDSVFSISTAGDFDFKAGNLITTGTLTAGVATLGDSSQMATSAVPTADAELANKKYVDDNSALITITADVNLVDGNVAQINQINGKIKKCTSGSPLICGVINETIAQNATGKMVIGGKKDVVCVGTVTIGDQLQGAATGKVKTYVYETSVQSNSVVAHSHDIPGGTLSSGEQTEDAGAHSHLVDWEFKTLHDGRAIGKALTGGTDTTITMIVSIM